SCGSPLSVCALERAGHLPPFYFYPAVQHARCYSHGSQESDEEFDARWVTYFNKPDIDAWELRKGTLNPKGRLIFIWL
uniref:Cytochrome c oxidase subunit 5A, mitochondrial n=1 Tax=Phasianus colchicus TaxID=9054 RepID=A0A669QTK4_PHACC